MKRFFSHLPAWVERSACGICRASAIIIAIACSAVVMELPNGVFMTMMPRGGRRLDVDIVDADAGAAHRPSASWPADDFGVTLVAERMARPS